VTPFQEAPHIYILLLFQWCSSPYRALASSYEVPWSYTYRQLVGLLKRVISPSQGRYLHRTTQTQNKRRQTSMSLAVFSRLNNGIVGSNPARGMDVCMRLFYVCVVLCK
jgi:hypothetical protein